jgi:hypothetical protein
MADDKETVRDLLEAALKQLEKESLDNAGAREIASKEHPAIVSRETHPGLERFQLSEHSSTKEARKPCFMEPDRVCVNSGACEMRGY